ncbi:TolC family outer membrane protein [Granulosicoccus sp. 3-233]|uniref:TolC family outer membrane protein n=1 Tax=Granulosicoccus sp. 3-233 TaxID=3417969 RepID=UPI003D344162
MKTLIDPSTTRPRVAACLACSALLALPLLWSSAASATDLEDVYEQARQYDAEYSAARYDLEAARQLIPTARSSFLPQLAFGAEAGLTTLADDGEGPYEDTALSLSLSQTLFNRAFGKTLDQAEITVLQAEAQYAALGQALILRVATAYFEVLRSQAIVEFSQSELEAISRQLEQAERRYDVGLVPITDVRSAQAQHDLAVAQEIAASNQLSTAREALVLISGVNTESLAQLADDLPLLPPEPADIDAWVDQALEQNLELLIARYAEESSTTQVAIERASRYPTLDLVGTAASNTTDQTLRSDSDVAEIKLQLSVPILTGGRINAQVAQARAEALSAGEQLLAQERATTQQTRDGYRGVQASISRVKALRQALESTRKSAEATEAGFRAGTRTSVEVLQALRDTFSARSDYAGARYDYIINTLNLKAASGTLSESDLLSVNRFLAEPESD